MLEYVFQNFAHIYNVHMKPPSDHLCSASDSNIFEFAWNRDAGMKGLFTGVGPRVGRAGPSVGIVISFYEVVKYVLHNRYNTSQ